MAETSIYLRARERLIALARDLDADEAATAVDACPGWTVKDVVAHVVGIAADIVDRNMDGVGTDAWTAAQVRRRREQTLDDVLDEWEALAPDIDRILAASPGLAPRAGRDALVHEFDIRAAVGRPGGRDDDLVTELTATYARDFVSRVDDAGLAPVAVEVGDVVVGDPDAEVRVAGSPYELLRCLTGRRSRPQVEALDWTGGTDEHVARFTSYGSFPITDVVE